MLAVGAVALLRDIEVIEKDQAAAVDVVLQGGHDGEVGPDKKDKRNKYSEVFKLLRTLKSKKGPEKKPPIDDLETAKVRARAGDFEGAKYLIEKGAIADEDMEKLGISRAERELYQRAVDYRTHISILEDQEGKFQELMGGIEQDRSEGVTFLGGADSPENIVFLQFQHLYNLLLSQAEIDWEKGTSIVDPQFLSLLGVTESELRDLAIQITCVLGGDGDFENGLAYFRWAFGFEKNCPFG